MKLSYIVPVHNPVESVFEKCVKSLRDQALEDWEAIFVLDGEIQLARDVIERNKDRRFRIVAIEHGGAQKARNAGGAEAKGELLCFFDSDCVLEPGASTVWIEQLDKNPDAAFVYSGYRFFGDKYAIESEPFDPWSLRIRNYISGCFPVRREYYPGWNESLKSLQDWDMWLSVLDQAEAAGKDISKLGIFVKGFAFSTPLPTKDSISGKGCGPDVWLERYEAVKNLHNLPSREVCVSSLQNRHEAKALAKLIDADFLTIANDKPHRYKTIVQIGFSMGANAEKHAAMFQEKDVKKVLFWTGDNISEMYNVISLKTIDTMAQLLNDCVKQFCEDKEAKRLLERAGFKAEILPLPIGEAKPLPVPEVKRWLVDMSGDFSPVVAVIAKSLPDIDLEIVDGAANLKEYCGLIHLFPDRTLSSTMKRALLTGRHVISNVQQPYCGYINDKGDLEGFVIEAVTRIRELSRKEPKPEAITYYKTDATRVLEAVR